MSDIYPWEQYPLHELEEKGIATLGRGNIISKKDIQSNPGGFPIYSSSAKGEGLFGTYGDYMFDDEMITWSVDGGGNLFYRPRHKFSVTNVSGYMRLDTSVLDYRFAHASLALQHSKLTFDYQTKAHPSVIRNLYHLPIPPLPEQKKIAEILSGIDKVLTSLQLHADKLRLARDEVVATFFSDESKSDEIAEIRSFGEIVTGSTPPTNNPLNYGGAMPFISPGDIGDSAVVTETKSTLSAAGAEMSRVIPPSSVCVVCIGSTIGKVALTTTESATNQQINALTPGAYDPFFMLAAISHMRNEIRNAASTHAVPIINKSRFGEISIPKPNIERQSQFGSYISSSHKMLSQIMMEIQKYQYLKKALSSDLLSGRKRVSI